jgi:hypothetical protein
VSSTERYIRGVQKKRYYPTLSGQVTLDPPSAERLGNQTWVLKTLKVSNSLGVRCCIAILKTICGQDLEETKGSSICPQRIGILSLYFAL